VMMGILAISILSAVTNVFLLRFFPGTKRVEQQGGAVDGAKKRELRGQRGLDGLLWFGKKK